MLSDMLVYTVLVVVLIFTEFHSLETANTPTNLTYQCRLDGWYIGINVTSFGNGVTSSATNDVYLGKENCTGLLRDSETLVFHYPYDSCGHTTETLHDVVLFRNTLNLANTNRSSGAPPVWTIILACILSRDQTAILHYTPVVKPATSYTFTSPRTPDIHSTSKPNVLQTETGTSHTPSTRQTTTHTYSTNTRTTIRHHSTPALCHVCSGTLCGLLPQTEKVQRCTGQEPFCMNSVKITADGQKSYVKRCVNQRTCETLWWQKTSDQDVCIKYNPLLTYHDRAFECHYCCVSDRCNSDIYPKDSTLYQGKT